MNRRAFINRISEDAFLRSFFTLLSGSSLGTLIAFLAQLLLVRLYPDTLFGLLDVFIALVMPLSVVASLRIEDAVFLPEKEEDAAKVFQTAAWLTGITSLVLFAATCLFGQQIADLLRIPDISAWVCWIAPAAAAIAWVRLGENALNRNRFFGPISSGRIVQSTSTAAGQVATGIPGPSAGGLILPHVAGRVLTSVFLYWRVRSTMPGFLSSRFSLSAVRNTLATYRRFVQFTTPATLLTSLSAQLPYYLLAFFFSEQTVGLFGRGHKLLALPAALIAGAVGKIFMVDAAEAQRTGNLANSVENVFTRMIRFGVFPTVVAMMAGTPVFVFLLGQEWAEAGTYAGYLAPWIFLTVVASNLTPVFDVTSNQKADFVSGLTILVLQAAALYIGSLSGNPVNAVLYMVVTGSILRVFQVLWLFRLSRTRLQTMFGAVGKQIITILPGIALVLASLSTGSGLLVCLAAMLGWLVDAFLHARLFHNNR